MEDTEKRKLLQIDIFVTLLWMSGLERIPTDKQKLLLALHAAGEAFSRIRGFALVPEDTHYWFSGTGDVGDMLFTLKLRNLVDIAPFTDMREYVLNREALAGYVKNILKLAFTEEQLGQCMRASTIFVEKLEQYGDLDGIEAFKLDFPDDE